VSCFDGTLSESFEGFVGVRQEECLSPVLFSLYLNDMEEELKNKGLEGITVGALKLFLLLYADDTVLFSETEEGLQQTLDAFETYCEKWKLTINTDKTKVMIFRRGGRLRENTRFSINNLELEIVNEFKYLGIKFSTSGSFSSTQLAMAEKGMKALFALQKHLQDFTDITYSHTLSRYDKISSTRSHIWV
jgi:hypothetical protein